MARAKTPLKARFKRHRGQIKTYYRRWFASRTQAEATNRIVTIHIGPHKTGTSTIQRMLKNNITLFAPELTVIPRNDLALSDLTQTCIWARTEKELNDSIGEIQKQARRLALSCRHRSKMLCSNEDLMGGLPCRRDEVGLYQLGAAKLKLISDAMEKTGCKVRFVFYTRDFAKWVPSLQRQLRQGATNYLPAEKFKKRAQFPDDWQELLNDLRAVLRPDQLHVLSFEDDACDGKLGADLLRYCGLSDAMLSQANWPDPVMVSNPATVTDAQQADPSGQNQPR